MRRRAQFQPYCVYDAMGYVRLLRIAAEQVEDIVRLVTWDTTRDHLHSFEVGAGQIGESGTRYIKALSHPVTNANDFKAKALRHGATAEAIRLLGLVVPVSKQEEIDMAEKLKAKSGGKAPKTADAEALKSAAKAAPVGGKKEKPAIDATAATEKKVRGNPEALAKAREAGSAGREAARLRKLKALKKPKDIEARDGSFRKKMLEDVLRSKTVGEFYDIGKENNLKYDAGCLKFAVDNEYVSVS